MGRRSEQNAEFLPETPFEQTQTHRPTRSNWAQILRLQTFPYLYIHTVCVFPGLFCPPLYLSASFFSPIRGARQSKRFPTHLNGLDKYGAGSVGSLNVCFGKRDFFLLQPKNAKDSFSKSILATPQVCFSE